MPEVMSIEVDEEFDPRPPAQPLGMRGPDGKLNIGLIAGVVVAVILVIALIVVIANPFGSDKKPVAVATFTPVDPLKDSKAIPLYSPNSDIVQDLQTSLEDWALYYTTGRIEDLSESFDLAGKQYAALLKEQPSIVAAPEPGLPSKIELGTVGNAGKQGNLYTLRADITWTKPGDTPTNFKWDVTLKKDNNINKYLLSTTKTTESDASNALAFCDAVKIVKKLQNDDKVNAEFAKLNLEDRKVAIGAVFNIRLKVWKFVQPAFEESKAPDSVALIVEQYSESLKLLDSAADLTEFSGQIAELYDDDALLQARTDAEEAASTECEGIDISKR